MGEIAQAKDADRQQEAPKGSGKTPQAAQKREALVLGESAFPDQQTKRKDRQKTGQQRPEKERPEVPLVATAVCPACPERSRREPDLCYSVSITRSKPKARPYALGGTAAASRALRPGVRAPRPSQAATRDSST